MILNPLKSLLNCTNVMEAIVLEIACGIDIIEISRVKKAVEENGERFVNKVFTLNEIDYCEKRSAAKHQHYAARFAAKEAVAKALGLGMTNGICWTDIEVLKDENGKPLIKLYGQAERIAAQMGVKSLNLSLSHCHEYAVANATCIVE